MRSVARRLRASASQAFNNFGRDKNGNIAMIFALSLIPVMGAVGLGIDYLRASDAETTMQAASDTAALAAAIDLTLTYQQKKDRAVGAVQAAMQLKPWINYDPSGIDLTITADGAHTVSFPATMDTSIIAVLGYQTMNLSTTATALAGSDKSLEIALALDNTGSMVNDMTSLKSAASSFVTTLFQKAPKGKLKVGLVPFVAAVNPGKSFIDNAAMADYQAQSPNHGYLLSSQWVRGSGCNYPPQPPGPGPSPGPSPTPTGPGKSGGSDKKHTWLENMFGSAGSKLAYVSSELFGMKAAHAQSKGGTTPATDFTGMTNTWSPYTLIDPAGNSIPLHVPTATGGNNYSFTSDGCVLINPTVNHFDLFNRIPGASWKGCVEARPDPYDMTDDAPNESDARSKFVPYFWPSEPTSNNSVINDPASFYNNNYLANHPVPLANDRLDSWGFAADDGGGAVKDLMKYSGTNNGSTIKISEAGPDTVGPNKSCPNEVTPLSSDPILLNAEINKLMHWYGGGTVTSEGLMWAWRVLSPNLPYATAQPYDPSKVKKYIVLMSDGVNDVVDNGPRNGDGNPSAEIWTDYTAYGAMWDSRGFAPGVPGSGWNTVKNFDDARAILNERFQTACTNAKAKGITVYTIYFREDDPVAINYLQQCSGVNNFYRAANADQLRSAFSEIASSIYAVRLSK